MLRRVQSPCRRVSDTSSLRCGPPSAVWQSGLYVFVAFHLSIVVFFLLYFVTCSDALTLSSSCLSVFVCRRPRLKASLHCAIQVADSSCQQLSLRKYTFLRLCLHTVWPGNGQCFIALSLLPRCNLWSMFVFGSSCTNLCTHAMFCFKCTV